MLNGSIDPLDGWTATSNRNAPVDSLSTLGYNCTVSKVSLAEFAANEPPRPSQAWVYRVLPKEVRDEIIREKAKGTKSSTICRWLHAEGYADATKGRVEELWRK